MGLSAFTFAHQAPKNDIGLRLNDVLGWFKVTEIHWYQSKALRDFLLLTNSNLSRISHRFRDCDQKFRNHFFTQFLSILSRLLAARDWGHLL